MSRFVAGRGGRLDLARAWGSRLLYAASAAATLATAALAATPAAMPAVVPTPVIATQEGPVQGRERYGVHVYTGLPFAAPPVGPLRLRPPQPVTPWRETLQAVRPIPNCIQFGGQNPRPQSEDCLYLNVYAPAKARSGTAVPVMVWIFGSGLYTNGPQDYDGTLLAREGVLLVTINHRLGLLGLMLHDSLDEPGALSGNYALRDVQAALRWVQRNIAAFGGNPANVTVFGDSAGGRLATAQLISPPARGLVAKLIGMSVGGLDRAGWRGGQVVAPREKMLAGPAREVVRALGCEGQSDVAACLRTAPVSAYLGTGLGPTAIPLVFDPELLPTDPVAAFRSGDFAALPTMMGTGENEGAFQVIPEELARGRPLRREDLPALYRKYFGAEAERLAAAYPVERHATVDQSLVAVRTDVWQSCPTDFLWRSIAAKAPVYAYEVTARDLAQAWPGPEITQIPNSASHGSDVPYIFGFKDGQPLAGRHAELSQRLRRYWTHFAHTGQPEPTGKVWPPFSAAQPQVLGLDDQPRLSLDYAQRHNCSQLHQLGIVSAPAQAGNRVSE